MDYAWPGNVRELAHLIQRVVVLGKGPVADLDALPPALLQEGPAASGGFSEILPARELQHRYAVWALERCGSHKSRTAERLGIDIKTLNRWLMEGPGEEPANP
jgi:two-component system response regulator HydG